MAKNGSPRSVLGQKRVDKSTKAANTQFGLTCLANTTFHMFLAAHRPEPPDSRYFGQLSPGFGHILLHFVALHQSIRSDQPGVKEYTLYQVLGMVCFYKKLKNVSCEYYHENG